jgi:MutS domain V
LIRANDTYDSYYQENAAAYSAAIRELQQKLNGMSLLRLGIFAALVWDAYNLFEGYTLFLLLAAIALAGLFLFCINLHYSWKEKRRLLEKLRFVNENELNLRTGATNAFPDGANFGDADNYLEDLDIFGPHSLFHLLNRTTTVRGAAALADRLRQPLLGTEPILQTQEAIRTLAPQTERRQRLTATGLLLQDAPDREPMKPHADLDMDSLRQWLETPPRLLRNIPVRIAIYLLSLFNAYAIYQLFASNKYTLVLIGLVVSRALWSVFAGYINRQHRLIGHKHALLDQYAGILAVFNEIDMGQSAILQELQAHTGKAHTAIRKLSKLSSAFDQRMNLLVTTVLGTFFFYDLFCMIAAERWKLRNRNDLLVWIDAVARVEALNALATYAFNHQENNYPEPIAETPPPPAATTLFIEATALAHPLIPAARRVANDLTLGREEALILVTGSNMSGKTTFLRTLGVNLLMAQCGLPVCAATFRFTPMQLLTSLRISDSLQEQTSYFMAELKKLQKIIQRLQTGAPALVLIDEILRGTNSEDKTFGSEQFIRKLLGYRCLSLFASHDLSLGELEKELPGRVGNYCFESIIEGNELHFDYRLQRGIARNRNASFLMQKMQII